MSYANESAKDQTALVSYILFKILFFVNIAKNLQDLIKDLKIINVSLSINNNINNDCVFHLIDDYYNFMKKNAMIIVINEEFINDFY